MQNEITLGQARRRDALRKQSAHQYLTLEIIDARAIHQLMDSGKFCYI